MSIDSSSGFFQPRYLSDEAYMPVQEPGTPPYSLINFIAVAQRLKLGFLRITWQAARHGIGTGAMGSIREALFNLHTSFAFKCVSDKQKEKRSEDWIMRSFINEVIAHSHPSIERHSRVAHLEGICWDIATDEQGEDHVWPVLVFVKSQYGDLDNFMTLPAGRKLGLKERVSLCQDLGWAISDMHAHGFVHGDIKPANALVFRNKEKYIAKVMDFGFSSQCSGQNELLFVAASWPWCAPERDRDRFVAAQVQEMDMFSYGMLCFWVMFERHLSGIVPLPKEAQWAEQYFEEEQQQSGSLSLRVLDGLKRDKQLTRLAKQLIKDDKDFDDDDRQELGRLFDETLSYNPKDRVHAFEQFPYRKWRESSPVEQRKLDASNFQASQCRLELASSVEAFYNSDYRVSRRIRRLLEQQRLAVPDPHTAFQLALCNCIGFGGPRDGNSLASLLQYSGRSQKELEDSMATMASFDFMTEEFPGKTFRRLKESGHVPRESRVDQYRMDGKLQEAETELRRGLEDLKQSLGESSRPWMTRAMELSKVYKALGMEKDAQQLHVRMKEVLRGAVLPENERPEILVGEASMCRELGQLNKAEELQTKVVDLRKDQLGEEHAQTLTDMANLASIYYAQKEWKKAEALQVKVLDLRKRVLGEEHADTLHSMHNLAMTYSKQEQWDKSIDLQVQLVEKSKAVLGEEHAITLRYISELASKYGEKGFWKEAQELENQVIETKKMTIGQGHPDTLASMESLAITLSRQGKHDQAEQISRQVLTLSEDVSRRGARTRDDPSALRKLNAWAELLDRQGKYTEAEPIHREALARSEMAFGKKDSYTLLSIHNLAGCLRLQGKYAEAERLGQENLALRIDVLGKENPRTLLAMNNVGLVLRLQGKYAEAEKVYHETVALRKKILGTDHDDTLISMNGLSMVFRDQGKYGQAEQTAQEVLEMREKKYGKTNLLLIPIKNNLATIYNDQGKYVEAEKMLQETVRRRAELSGENHPDTLTIKSNLADALNGQRKWVEAEHMHQDIVATRKIKLGEEHPDTLKSTVKLAGVQSGQGKHVEALQLYEHACKIYEKTLGLEHPDTQTCLKHCAESRRRIDEQASTDDGRSNVLQPGNSDGVAEDCTGALGRLGI